jgi:hypothetical protein
MPSKPRSEWSASYRRRVERGEARGLSKQAARGHKPEEHKTRESRAREQGRLTASDKAWLARQAARIDSSANPQRWEAAVAAFTALSPDERFEIREAQRRRERDRRFALLYGVYPVNELSPLLLSSRSGLR